MKKTGKVAEEFSETIPNPSGIPGKDQESAEIREGHREWKKHIEDVKAEKSMEQAYWRRAGSCSYF